MLRRLVTAAIISGSILCFQDRPARAIEVHSDDPFAHALPVPGAQFNFEFKDDLDYDGRPDDWTRRTGVEFPAYIEAAIESSVGVGGSRALCVKSDGGRMTYYSPPVRIEPAHSYVFTGQVRTTGLQHDAALISLSFLDAKRERIRHVVSPPVSGTHANWIPIRLGPVMPDDRVRFVVIACHLVNAEGVDYDGAVYFDNFSLRMLPRLVLATNFASQFQEVERPFELTATTSGLDPDIPYRLDLYRINELGETLSEERIPLTALLQGAEDQTSVVIRREWSFNPQERGFYRVRAELYRHDEMILTEQTSFVVIDLIKPLPGEDLSMATGEFAWSLGSLPIQLDPKEFLRVATESGINWLKLPLWDGTGAGTTTERVLLLQSLKKQGITPVGILSNPPRELRKKFADDWRGVNEIFALPPSFWRDSLTGIMTRYSTVVRYWQLGGETDASFGTVPQLSNQLFEIKREFDRLGRDTVLGVHWPWGSPIPKHHGIEKPFLSLGSRERISNIDLERQLRASSDSGFHRWVLIRPLPETAEPTLDVASVEYRAATLIQDIVSARIAGADAIVLEDVFDPERGLLHEDGSPKELYLPWRTTALALKGSNYMGSFVCPYGSINHVFDRGNTAVVLIWNEQRGVEEMNLGENIEAVTIWGRSATLPKIDNRQRIPVGPVPLLLRNVSRDLARFRMGVEFQKGKMPSSTDEFADTLILRNVFPQGVSGKAELLVPRDWEVRPRQIQFTLGTGQVERIPVVFKLPSHASLGPQLMQIEFALDADRFYEFTVHRNLVVGLGDVTIDVATTLTDPDILEVRQTITNNTSESLDFVVSLYAPGMRRQKRRVSRLAGGEKNILTYRLPNASRLIGESLRIRAEQEGGNRVLNKTWTVEPPSDPVPINTRHEQATPPPL